MNWKNNKVMIIVGCIASVLAALPLLDLRVMFYTDWNNHLWAIEYFGECIKHWGIPDVINTHQLIGMSLTFFYAQKFYALAGILSAFLGSAIAVRIMVLGVLFLQYYQVYRAAMKVGSPRQVSMVIAVITTWAIYPLTNLYNRSALTEFFAVALLTCSLASFLCVILESKEKVSKYDIVGTGFFFVLSAITHPLTALFGGLFMAILGIIALLFCEKSRKLWLALYFSITAVLSVLILSPWVYFLHLFKDKIYLGSPMDSASCFLGGGFFPKSIDNVMSRLCPFPVDFRSIKQGVQVSTPYLDAQIMVPLILLAGILIYLGKMDKNTKPRMGVFEGGIMGGALIILLIALTESILPKIFGPMSSFFYILQFPYRLTTYINLPLLVIVIMLAGRYSGVHVTRQQLLNVLLAFCIGMSFSSLSVKLLHALSIRQKSTKVEEGSWAPMPFGSNKHLAELPNTFYGAEQYTINYGFSKDTVSNFVPVQFGNFNVLEGSHFGQVEPLSFSLLTPTLLVTNVQPFPWNKIIVNGVAQAQNSIFVAGGREAVLLPGGNYVLNIVTNMDGTWRALNCLSWVLLWSWMLVFAVVIFVQLRTDQSNGVSKEKIL